MKRVKGEALPGLQLTPRDREIIKAVYDCRALTTAHIERLFFSPSSRSQCLLRLKLLFQHQFLFRAEQPVGLADQRKPLVYWLDRHGAELIAEMEGCLVKELDWSPREHNVEWPFLKHLLLSNDFRVAVTAATRDHNECELVEWRDERDLRRAHRDDKVTIHIKDQQGNEKAEQVTIIPDGYFLLDTPKRKHHLFLEIDRATETGRARSGGRDWERKIKAYLAYYSSGKYHDRYHAKGMRVLTVTTGEKRLAHLKQVTEEAGGRVRFWFTTFDQITPENVLDAAIWQVASEEGLRSLIWE